MGRKPKSLREAIGVVLEEESQSVKEFNVKVTDDKGKFWIGFIKARNKDSALAQFKESLGAKWKECSFEIV